MDKDYLPCKECLKNEVKLLRKALEIATGEANLRGKKLDTVNLRSNVTPEDFIALAAAPTGCYM